MTHRSPRPTLEELRSQVAARVDARLEGGRLLRGPAALTIAEVGDFLVLEAPPEPSRLLPLDSTCASVIHAADLLLFRAGAARSSPSVAVQLAEDLCALPGAARLAANRVRLGGLQIEVCPTGVLLTAFLPFGPET